MKINKKFLIIFILFFLSFISQINYGICSDNAPVAPNTMQGISSAQQQVPVTAVPQQQPVQSVTPQATQAVPPNIQTGGATNANQGFFPAFMNMIKSLVNVIVLFLAMAGIFILYRRMKSKSPSGAKPKKQKGQESESVEPTNVSEAVSSFIRHKIKRTS